MASSSSLVVFYSKKEKEHQPALEVFEGGVVQRPFEVTERCDIILTALQAEKTESGGPLFSAEIVEPADHGRGPLQAVHTDDYLSFMETAWSEWELRGGGQGREKKMSPVLLASTFVPRRAPIHADDNNNSAQRHPRGASISAKMGFYSFDTGCPLVAGTWPAAYDAAQCSVSAAKLLLSEAPPAVTLSLSRPPGHHAGRDFMGGYCYINNAAIAARHLFEQSGGKRVAVLDLDYHAGNGTQDIFYGSSDVLVISLHCDPSDEYPYHIGFADETGEGQGLGFHLNLPLPPGTDDTVWLGAVGTAIGRIEEFQPGFVVVSFGVDISIHDPLGNFKVTDEALVAAARMIAKLQRPTLVVQEGGYASAALGTSVVAFLNGFYEQQA